MSGKAAVGSHEACMHGACMAGTVHVQPAVIGQSKKAHTQNTLLSRY